MRWRIWGIMIMIMGVGISGVVVVMILVEGISRDDGRGGLTGS
jgi:hypothetical protein